MLGDFQHRSSADSTFSRVTQLLVKRAIPVGYLTF
jgi:hypothetical protein